MIALLHKANEIEIVHVRSTERVDEIIALMQFGDALYKIPDAFAQPHRQDDLMRFLRSEQGQANKIAI